MRTIKFRGKRAKFNPEYGQSEWVYGNLLNECSIGEVGYNLESYTYAEVIPETVGQFTGLTDKNGVEVWEGDIISHNGVNSNAENNKHLFIEFKDGAFCLTAKGVVEFTDRSCDIREMMFQAKRAGFILELEVIGNIHDKKQTT